MNNICKGKFNIIVCICWYYYFISKINDFYNRPFHKIRVTLKSELYNTVLDQP